MKDIARFISSYFGIDKEVVVPMLVTLFVFVSGVIINQVIKLWESYVIRRTHRKVFKINILLLIPEILKQSKAYRNLRDQFVIDHQGAFVVTYKMFTPISVLLKIGYENFYNSQLSGIENLLSLRRSRKIQAFNTIWKSVEYLNQAQSTSLKTIDAAIEKNGQLNELRNDAIGKAQIVVEKFAISFHRKLESTEPLGRYYIEREKIISKFAKKKSTLPTDVDQYLTELLEQNRSQVDLIYRYESDVNSVELNSYLLLASNRFINMCNHMEANNNYFNYLHAEYEKTYLSVKNVYRILYPKKNKILIGKALRLFKETIGNKLIMLS